MRRPVYSTSPMRACQWTNRLTPAGNEPSSLTLDAHLRKTGYADPAIRGFGNRNGTGAHTGSGDRGYPILDCHGVPSLPGGLHLQ